MRKTKRTKIDNLQKQQALNMWASGRKNKEKEKAR